MPPEPLVLAFDTSAAHCAAALLRGERVLAARVESMQKGQAERLMVLLGEILSEGGAELHDLTAIAVGIGPGNFTGIRISVAAARGLALALGIPAIGIGSLEAVAEGLARPVRAVLDARSGAFYVQDFEAGAGKPRLMAAAEREAAVLTGPGAEALAATTGARVVAAAQPLAVAIARIAIVRLLAGEAGPRPAPLYLRSADAAPPAEAPPQLLPG